MISIARNTGSSLGPRRNSGIKKNTTSAREHNAFSKIFPLGLIVPILCRRKKIASDTLAKMANPLSQNHARMYPPPRLGCRTAMIINDSRMIPIRDRTMTNTSTYTEIIKKYCQPIAIQCSVKMFKILYYSAIHLLRMNLPFCSKFSIVLK